MLYWVYKKQAWILEYYNIVQIMCLSPLVKSVSFSFTGTIVGGGIPPGESGRLS